MSDYVHAGNRSKSSTGHLTIEGRLIFGVCFVAALASAIVTRLMPWRKGAALAPGSFRQSIFREAHGVAGVWVASSFMGL